MMNDTGETGWSPKFRYALASLRIVLGLTFLWAFFDKLLGLTFSTAAANAWKFGMGAGSPTRGYLNTSYGPLGGMFKAMAGNGAVDWLFMLGLLAAGLALTFGAAARIGAWGGFTMVLLMYASHPILWTMFDSTLTKTSHPFLDDHITEAAAFWLLALTPSGDTWGLGKWWRGLTPKLRWLH